MEEKNNNSEKVNEEPKHVKGISAQDVKDKRQIIIETDGNGFQITKIQCTNLELKEICRQIIMKLGG